MTISWGLRPFLYVLFRRDIAADIFLHILEADSVHPLQPTDDASERQDYRTLTGTCGE